MSEIICDDKLIEIISMELSRQGIIPPLSEIEKSVVLGYTNIRKAHAENNSTVTINRNIKDARYYDILKNVVCADIISRARLANARNGYEVASNLALLQGYLDGLSEVAGTIHTEAPEVFSEILNKLPVKVIHVSKTSDIQTNPNEIKITKVGQSCPTKPNKQCRVCTNLKDHGDLNLCSTCEASDPYESCRDCVSLSIMYKGLCFGTKVDPEVLGLNHHLYEGELSDKAMVIKNYITKMARELKKQAEKIYCGLRAAYLNPEEYEAYDDDDED